MRIHHKHTLTLTALTLLSALVSVNIRAAAPEAAEESSETSAESSATQGIIPTEPDASPPSPTPAISGALNRAKLLEKHLISIKDPSDILWLGETPNDTADSAYLGLYTPQYASREKGQVLILHDNQQHPDWPGLVHYLRTQLPAHGWSTLSISLPDFLAPSMWPLPPLQSDAQPSTPASLAALNAEFKPADVPAEVDRRAQQAIKKLKEASPLPITVVAIGTSATWISHYAQQWPTNTIAGLVIIDPTRVTGDHSLDYNPWRVDYTAPPTPDQGNPSFDTANAIAELTFPVLDIAPEIAPRSNQQHRRNTAKRLKKNRYRAVRITGSHSGFFGFEAHVAKTIRGWSKRLQR